MHPEPYRVVWGPKTRWRDYMERTLAWELLGTPGEVDKNTHKRCTFVGSTKTHQQKKKEKKRNIPRLK